MHHLRKRTGGLTSFDLAIPISARGASAVVAAFASALSGWLLSYRDGKRESRVVQETSGYENYAGITYAHLWHLQTRLGQVAPRHLALRPLAPREFQTSWVVEEAKTSRTRSRMLW